MTGGPGPYFRAQGEGCCRNLIHETRAVGVIDRPEPRARSLVRNAQHSNAALALGGVVVAPVLTPPEEAFDPLLDQVNLDHSDARSTVLALENRGIGSGCWIREKQGGLGVVRGLQTRGLD